MKREASELSAYLDLKIKDFGLVSLPLNKLQAEVLIKLCSQEPFGWYLDTLVGTQVRETYQLEPSSIVIENPQWVVPQNADMFWNFEIYFTE